TAFTASNPLAPCPTTSTCGSAARNSHSTARARGSSSTTAIRNGREEDSGIEGTGHINGHTESARARRRVKPRSATEHEGQPLADVLQPDTALLSRQGVRVAR